MCTLIMYIYIYRIPVYCYLKIFIQLFNQGWNRGQGSHIGLVHNPPSNALLKPQELRIIILSHVLFDFTDSESRHPAKGVAFWLVLPGPLIF